MMNIKITPQELKNIMLDYDFDTDDIFTEDAPEMIKVKKAYKQLVLSDRIILCLYAHLGSQVKVGKTIGISASLVALELKRIRKELNNIMDNDKTDY